MSACGYSTLTTLQVLHSRRRHPCAFDPALSTAYIVLAGSSLLLHLHNGNGYNTHHSLSGRRLPPWPTYKGRSVVPTRGCSWLPYLGVSEKEERTHSEDTVTSRELFDHKTLQKRKWKVVFVLSLTGWNGGSFTISMPISGRPGIWRELEPEKLGELLKTWNEYVKEWEVVEAAPQYGMLRVD